MKELIRVFIEKKVKKANLFNGTGRVETIGRRTQKLR